MHKDGTGKPTTKAIDGKQLPKSAERIRPGWIKKKSNLAFVRASEMRFNLDSRIMKTWTKRIALGSVLGFQTVHSVLCQPSPLPFAPLDAKISLPIVVERGPHHAVIQTVLPDGTTNTFTQLQTGLNRWSVIDRQYLPASAEVELVSGVPIARKTQYQAIFGTTLEDSQGVVDVLMLDGRRFRARPVGLAYTEFKSGQPGRSVFVAEVKSSAAEVTGPSEVTYADALSGVAASIRYQVSISGLEQDIELESALSPPGDLQMDERLVRAEVWNEILESPAPARQSSAIARSDGSIDEDDQLSLGAMLFGSGAAFDQAGKSIRVARQWQEIGGKTYLIESLP